MIPERLYERLVARAYTSLRNAIKVRGFCEGDVHLDPLRTPTILGELCRDASKLAWHPIDTCPKHDGMEVLLTSTENSIHGGVPVIGAWSHKEQRFKSHTMQDIGPSFCEHPGWGIADIEPTHWIPLPEAPSI